MNTQPFTRLRTFVLTICLVCSSALPALAQTTPAQSPAQSNACEEGSQASGAKYRVCSPPFTNQVILYAHGYVAPNQPVALTPAVIEGVSLELAANAFGYAFAETSYSVNGLAVQQGVADLVDLLSIYTQKFGAPGKTILFGVSEGGLITTLAIERHPQVFSGGLALCGPYGNFQQQLDYFGDFRTVFDFYFPGLTPGTPVSIPPSALDTWESTTYTTTVRPVITDTLNASKVDQLLAVTKAAFDVNDPTSKEQTIEDLLWYNVYATNDATLKLGGQPFGNQTRQYAGSSDDSALNQGVLRFSGEVTATQTISNYETTGLITRPLITMHTTGDPVVPFFHATGYQQKTVSADNPNLHEMRRVERYGHCKFTQLEIQGAFARLLEMIDTPPAAPLDEFVYLPVVSKP